MPIEKILAGGSLGFLGILSYFALGLFCKGLDHRRVKGDAPLHLHTICQPQPPPGSQSQHPSGPVVPAPAKILAAAAREPKIPAAGAHSHW